MNANSSPAASPEADGYQVDDLEIDVRTRRVLRAGVDLGVTSLSFDLLLVLIRASPGIVTFDALMGLVWPGVVVSPETLTQRVKLLRQALGDSADNPRYILAVRGHGYRLLAAAAEARADLAPAARTRVPMRRWGVVAAAVILSAGAGVSWWVFAPDRSGPSTTGDADAYQYFLQAESVVNGTPESFLAAINLYNEALARDPGFARALSGRAMNRAALVWTGSRLGRGLGEAQRDAEKALELDPADARAHVVLASMSAMRGQWSASQASFLAALKASPWDAEFHGRYAATLLLPTGQLRKAVDEAMEAQRLAPASGFPAAMLAFADQALGADAEAVDFADEAVSRGGDPRQMAPVYASAAARRGHYTAAAEHTIKVLPPALRDAGGGATVQMAYAALGDPATQKPALAALRTLTSEPAWERTDPRSKQAVLYLFAAFGAVDELYDEMNRMLRQGSGTSPQIIAIGSMWSPVMRTFRQDRRFPELVERLGLIDYWKQSGPPDGCKLSDSKLICN